MIIYNKEKCEGAFCEEAVGVVGENLVNEVEFLVKNFTGENVTACVHLRFSDGSVNSAVPQSVKAVDNGTYIVWRIGKNDIFRHGRVEVQLELRDGERLLQTEIVRLFAGESLPVEDREYSNPNSETLALRDEAKILWERTFEQNEKIEENIRLIAQSDITLKEDVRNKAVNKENLTAESYPSVEYLNNYYYDAEKVEELLDEVDESASLKINLKADKDSVDSAFAALNKTVSDNKAETDTALDRKADKATTLAGYKITDAYTKTLSDRMYSCPISIAFDENNIPLTFVSNSRLMSAHFSAVSEKIRYVYISSHVDTVDSDAFSDCTNLSAVYYGVNNNDRIDNFSAIIRSALPNNNIKTFHNTSRREISDFLINSIKSLSEIKYDSSNVENGSGTLSPATSTDTGCEGNFIYSKNGNTVTVAVNITKFLAGKNYVRMSGLPFKQNLSIRLASMLAKASSGDYVNVRIDGSWIYFTKSGSTFSDGETLIVTVTYII